jgi:hypothetical protein
MRPFPLKTYEAPDKAADNVANGVPDAFSFFFFFLTFCGSLNIFFPVELLSASDLYLISGHFS